MIAKHFRKPLLQSVTAVLIMSGTLAAFSQESGGLEEIIVTAQKVAENINDVGMSINAITGDELTRIGIASPDQLTKAVPGLNVTRGGYGLPIYTMRGVGFVDVVAGASPAVSLYLDEVPLPYPIMSRGVAIDVQRVEVLKGPQGTLFGQNATGGLVNYIANRPTDTLTAGVGASYGSYNAVNVNGFVSGPLTDTLKARVAVSADRGGDWQRSVTRDDHHGAARFTTARALLDWTPIDPLSFQFNVNGWVDKSDEQVGQLVAIATGPRTNPQTLAKFATYPRPDDGRNTDWNVLPAGGFTDPFSGETYDGFERDDNFLQLSLRGEYELTNDIKLTSITAKNKLRQSTMVDVDGTDALIYQVTSRASLDVFSQELRLSGTLGRAQWLIGGSYAHDEVLNLGGAYSDPAISSFGITGADSSSNLRVNTKAVFAHLDYAVLDSLHAVAGIRYTDVQQFNVACTLDPLDGNAGPGSLAFAFSRAASAILGHPVSIADGACATTTLATGQQGWVINRLNEHNVPFNVGLNWKVTPDSLLYTSVSRGYKAGSFSPNGAILSTSLDPAVQEQLKAYEVGFKLGLADNHLQLNGAAFHYDYKNKQVRGKISDPVLGSLSKTINVPTSRINGGELQVMFVPNSHWHTNAGVTYVDSKITGSLMAWPASGLGATPRELAGEALPLTPKWQGQADAEFSTPVSSSLDGFIGAHGQYQGSTYGGLGEESAFKIDSYATFDLRTGVHAQDERWSASVFVNNVTNKYSWNAVNLSGPDAIIRMANPPRTFGVRGNVRF